jgi:Phasin protein
LVNSKRNGPQQQRAAAMLSRSYIRSHGAGGEIPTKGVVSPLAPSAWSPLAAALSANAWAHEGFGSLGSEWQSFVGRQLQQNGALIQRLSQSRTSDQVVSAYADFWQQVAESCGKELTTLTKLMTGMTNKMVMTTQIVSQERRTRPAPRART